MHITRTDILVIPDMLHSYVGSGKQRTLQRHLLHAHIGGWYVYSGRPARHIQLLPCDCRTSVVQNAHANDQHPTGWCDLYYHKFALSYMAAICICNSVYIQGDASTAQENKITITLIAVVLLFLVCQSPSAIQLIYMMRCPDITPELQGIIIIA